MEDLRFLKLLMFSLQGWKKLNGNLMIGLELWHTEKI
ncbi:hypothetical protein BL107_09476 [Synechococcus sp. BL107]|nr:hypothetical protein BL107_09476 [Synechococcus sp. BL107]